MNDAMTGKKARRKLGERFHILPYILFPAGITGIVFFVRSGHLPLNRGALAGAAWLLLFILSYLSARSAENRRILENDKKEKLESVNRIRVAVKRINDKAFVLNDSYDGEKKSLAEMAVSAQALLPSTNLEASKMEYEILTTLTRLDFLCDKAIAGTDRGGDFHKELDNLSVKLRAREKL